MRSAFALGLTVLAMGIPLCAQQGQQDARKAGAMIPPLVFLSGSTTTNLPDSNAKVFSSGLLVKLPPLAVLSASTVAKIPDLHAKAFSSGLVLKLPDFAPAAATK